MLLLIRSPAAECFACTILPYIPEEHDLPDTALRKAMLQHHAKSCNHLSPSVRVCLLLMVDVRQP